jgi:hypothetical protein
MVKNERIQNIIIKLSECELKSSSSGKFISVLNKAYGYFEIYTIDNKIFTNNDQNFNIMNFSNKDSLHLLSFLRKTFSGCAVDLEWHFLNNEIAILMPIGKDGNFIKLEEKEEEIIKKTSIFNTKIIKNKNLNLSGEVHRIALCIFEYNKEKDKFELIKKEEK